MTAEMRLEQLAPRSTTNHTDHTSIDMTDDLTPTEAAQRANAKTTGELITEIAELADIDRDSQAAWLEAVSLSTLQQIWIDLSPAGVIDDGGVEGDVEANAAAEIDGLSTGVLGGQPTATDPELEDILGRMEEADRLANESGESGEKAELAATIVANSAGYEDVEGVLEDFPTMPALRTHKNRLSRGSGAPGTGMTANFDPGDDAEEDVPSGVL